MRRNGSTTFPTTTSAEMPWARSNRALACGRSSLDTLITLGDGLQDVDHVKASSARLTSLAGQLREFEMPQPIFKKSEREEWGAGVYNNRHTDLEMQTDLSKVVRQPASADQVVQ